eukprot:s4406_g2.t1
MLGKAWDLRKSFWQAVVIVFYVLGGPWKADYLMLNSQGHSASAHVHACFAHLRRSASQERAWHFGGSDIGLQHSGCFQCDGGLRSGSVLQGGFVSSVDLGGSQ